MVGCVVIEEAVIEPATQRSAALRRGGVAGEGAVVQRGGGRPAAGLGRVPHDRAVVHVAGVNRAPRAAGRVAGEGATVEVGRVGPAPIAAGLVVGEGTLAQEAQEGPASAPGRVGGEGAVGDDDVG